MAGPAYLLLLSSLHFSLSLSLIGPACHCGRSRLFFPPLFLPHPPRPFLSLSSIGPACHCGRSRQFLISPLLSKIFSTSSTPLPCLIGPACHCGRSRLIIPTLLIKTNILLASQIYPNSHRSLLIPTNLQDLQNLGLSQIFTDLHGPSQNLTPTQPFTPLSIIKNTIKKPQRSSQILKDPHRSPQIPKNL